jgi:hypothetical protein
LDPPSASGKKSKRSMEKKGNPVNIYDPKLEEDEGASIHLKVVK